MLLVLTRSLLSHKMTIPHPYASLPTTIHPTGALSKTTQNIASSTSCHLLVECGRFLMAFSPSFSEEACCLFSVSCISYFRHPQTFTVSCFFRSSATIPVRNYPLGFWLPDSTGIERRLRRFRKGGFPPRSSGNERLLGALCARLEHTQERGRRRQS